LTEDNIAQASPIERWAYFLLNADRLSRDDVSRIFPDQEFSEAAGVLEMISKSPEEHRVYDMRLKFQRDEATRLAATQREIEAARSEGRVEGETKGRVEGLREGVQKGVLLGRIAVLQELLGVAQPTADELSSFDENRLTELAEQLQTQLRNRNS
jgi:flagellar biosynthesis/type III secretory pathway protein FliH